MIHTLTVTGTGAQATLAALMAASPNYTGAQSNATRINWLQVETETGGGTVRLGDINTSVSYGLPITATAGMFLPPVHQIAHCYSATSIYLYIPNGTVVSFLWDA